MALPLITQNAPSTVPLGLKQTFYYGIAAMALLALAGPYPRVATGFTVLLIAGVVLTHWSDYVGYLTPPTQKGG